MKNKKKLLFLIPMLFFALVIGISLKKSDENIAEEPKESKVQFYISDDVDIYGEKYQGNNFSDTPKSFAPVIQTDKDNHIFYVYFIDVGQADCTFIKTEDENILIDGGNNEDGDDIVSFLTSLGVSHIDTIIATHMHEDHIGGLDDIMDAIETDKVYLPDTREEDLPDTKTYQDFIQAIEKNDVLCIIPKQGDYIYQNGSTSLRVLSPDNPPAGDLNDYSIVVKGQNGAHSFLFMGDASTQINAILEDDFPKSYLDVDVLKAGHHGSSTAIDKSWLRTTRPEYTIISCGKNNDYGHPHKEVVWALRNMGSKTYRMDEDGTVMVESDGVNLTFKTGLTGKISLGDEGWSLPY